MEKKTKNKSIINMIREVPVALPPDDFTDRVMVHVGLRATRRGVVEQIREFLMRPRNLRGFSLFPAKITKGQCAFYCILVSLFYLTMGMVFSWSLKIISNTTYQAIWLLHQPEFFVCHRDRFCSAGRVFYFKTTGIGRIGQDRDTGLSGGNYYQ